MIQIPIKEDDAIILTQIPLIESAEVIVVPHAPAPAAELFIVVAYSKGLGWSIPSQARGPWNHYEAAAKAAIHLASCWTYRLVVKILIPGRKS